MNNAVAPGSRLMVFSKNASIGILLLIAVVALIVLAFVYFQGGVPHIVHQ